MTSRIAIDDPSQSAEARREAMRMASAYGFDEIRAGQVGIVVTEACTNILKHAGSGEVLLQVTDPGIADAVPDLEMLAIDRGPGMDNVEKCLRDGFSTGGTPGHGLGAIQRLSSESDFYSRPGEGTVLVARWKSGSRRTGGLQFGAVNVPKRGETVCGDSWGMEHSGDFFSVMVADGLGHGFEASVASQEAVRILRQYHEMNPGTLVDFTHKALRSFRGAAVAIARIDCNAFSLSFSGLGNVAAQMYGGGAKPQHLVSVNGTAGHQAVRIREFSYPWPGTGGVLVMYSDGLATGTNLDSKPGLGLHDPTLIAGVLYRDFSRGHDDATVVVAKAA